MNIRYPIYEGVYRILTRKQAKYPPVRVYRIGLWYRDQMGEGNAEG